MLCHSRSVVVTFPNAAFIQRWRSASLFGSMGAGLGFDFVRAPSAPVLEDPRVAAAATTGEADDDAGVDDAPAARTG